MSKYFPPLYKSTAFHCLYCNVKANQGWYEAYYYVNTLHPIEINGNSVGVSLCSHCLQATFWLSEKIIYPSVQIFPPPNNDLGDDIKEVYDEAAVIAEKSPRAACALLRLAIEMLLKQLGETGTLNEGIKNLVKKGLNPQIQQSLDILRVTGNNAIHPGKIDFAETADVRVLFELINVIADTLITQPKRIRGIYDNLPEESKKAIEKRDGKTI
ncbi:MAG: DUF4145 domain-containing protein [Candidatus Dadabacteria bacterium]|nr:DUF4145 domain-containing protein [Candidatus Dadabacteria bacterium]